MNKIARGVSAAILAMASQAATAGTDTWFTPLTGSAIVGTSNDVNELTSPWVAPEEVKFTNLMSLREAESSINESIIRVPQAAPYGASASMIDMIAYDPKGKYLFLPHEIFMGAGLSRYNIKKDETQVLFAGNQQGPVTGDWTYDFGAFDPARITPNGTLIAGEEWSGRGRVIEVLNPYDKAPEDPQAAVRGDWRVLDAFPLVAQEGIGFSKQKYNKVIYFVDENNSGSIYKLVLKKKGDYTRGQTFVLKVDNFNDDPAANWDDVTGSRTGNATWVPMTDRRGNPLTETNPFGDDAEKFSGRQAADEVGGTPYGRPEDVEVGTLANGNEVLYFAATSERTVYSIEMKGRNKAIVREFASDANTLKNDGFVGTTAEMNSPDNLAQDALGNIYIIEDAPNSSSIGGDVWFARDTNNDGVAESIDHFMSLRVAGSEATGMIFNPVKPAEFAIAVQHPTSTDLSIITDGFGDAVWKAEIKKTAQNKDFLKALKKQNKKNRREHKDD